MATLEIPVSTYPHQQVTVNLEGTNYGLEVRWNERAGAWFLALLDEDGTILLSGKKLVADWPLVGWRETDPRLPPGDLVALDTSGRGLPPTADDLGTRVKLTYVESEQEVTVQPDGVSYVIGSCLPGLTRTFKVEIPDGRAPRLAVDAACTIRTTRYSSDPFLDPPAMQRAPSGIIRLTGSYLTCMVPVLDHDRASAQSVKRTAQTPLTLTVTRERAA